MKRIFTLFLLFAALFARLQSGPIVAGVRSSRILENYPGGVFPSTNYWISAIDSIHEKFSGSMPGAVWIVGLYQGSGVTSLDFPSSQSYDDIEFGSGDSSEPYLAAFDRTGYKIWLQVEPGAASVDTLIKLVLDRYRHHTCVAGFGVDVEWYKANTNANGKAVSDAEAQRWEQEVKAYNLNYTLFLKHWLPEKMPPAYRGDILFVDDGQQFSSLGEMRSDFVSWAATFPSNNVGFQFGYPADSSWWKAYSDPAKTIGDSLIAAIPNVQAVFWVDFTLTRLVPVPQMFYVFSSGSDGNPGTELLPWKTIQKAFNSATAGSTVFIKAGVYNEKTTVNASGSPAGGYITFQNYLNDTAVIDGTGITGDQLILISNKHYIRINGLELRNNLDQTFGTGIWIQGYGNHIELLNNRIHAMRAAAGGGDAMGISVYGSDAATAISNVLIDHNEIYDCQPGHSESLTLNGNVDTFRVTNNLVHDNNNIGIDMIGGEATSPTSSLDAARNGVCSDNVVYNCHSRYGGGYAAGIYVDGGRDIIVERNIVHNCDVGFEIGCENKGKTASGMIVRDNLSYDNDKGGMGLGGYDYPRTGQVITSAFYNNTCYHNDRMKTGEGEIYVDYALNCAIRNNIFFSNDQNRILVTTIGNGSNNTLDYNLWFTPGGSNNVSTDYNGTVCSTFAEYRNATGQDSHSIFADPKLIDTASAELNVRLQPGSPAIDDGDPGRIPAGGETDPDGNPRLAGARTDMGAYEYGSAASPVPPAPILIGEGGDPFAPQLLWHRSQGAAWYHLQIASDGQFRILLVDDTTLTDTVFQTPSMPESAFVHWRVRAKNVSGSGDWSTAWSFFVAGGSMRVAVNDRWNMISIPLITGDSNKIALFPHAVSPAYEYDGLYNITDLLLPGFGYWLKFNGAQSVGLIGTLIASETLHVLQGWNMIGSISAPIPVDSVHMITPELSTSRFFGYEGQYFAADTLKPGKGYWLKANQAGDIIVSSPSGKYIRRKPAGVRILFPQK